jgi:hypothetical protein
VELSSGDDDVSKIDALATEPRAPISDEVDGEGTSSDTSSDELIIPGLISSNMLAQTDPPVADRVISSAPFTGEQKWKRPPPAPSANQQSLWQIR